MSFREKNAWIVVLTTLAVWIYYFAAFWLDVFSRQLDGGQVLTRFLICMDISLMVMIGLNIATSIMISKNIDTPPNELERQIEARADRIGFKLLEALVSLGLISGLLATDTIRTAFPADPAGSLALIFANGILMALVVTEVMRETVHIVSFRVTA
ncbi:MAG: hypothetical protein MO846_07995 [Candidatus Devosia symbiotica]|nr:hypothetical protein [Candidatus Devosia symbiotica]